MKQKITLKNIKAYIEGNIQMRLDGLGMKPSYYQEQIAYRFLQCRDCLQIGECKNCGCDVPGKLYVNESCNNGERFPDIMNEKDWNLYKEQNGIS